MTGFPDTAMVFAAGLGNRMRPLTEAMPKPLIEVAGRPLIDHALALLHAAGISRILANTHYLADQMGPALARRGVTAVHEPVLLDTGGGLRNARGALGQETVITLNSDAVWTGANPVEALRGAWRPETMDALVVLIPPERATGHTGAGDFLMSQAGDLRRGPGLVYGGVQVIKMTALEGIGDAVFSLNAVWDRLIARRRLFGVLHAGGWCDVGRPENIALAEDMLAGADV